MNKRFFSVLIIVFLLTGIVLPATAVENRSSYYVKSYYAYLTQGNKRGEIVLNYNVRGTQLNATIIGVRKIEVYTTNGSLYRTIFGTTANGLIRASGNLAEGTYSIICAPNTYYYAIVTVIAGDTAGSNSHDTTTNTVRSYP